MQGRTNGDESPHGERQTTVVPAARKDSYVDMTTRPVIEPTSFLIIHGAVFSSSTAGIELGSTGPNEDVVVVIAKMIEQWSGV